MLSNSCWRRKKSSLSFRKSTYITAPPAYQTYYSSTAALYRNASEQSSFVDAEFAQWFTWCILQTLRQFYLQTVIAELAGVRHHEDDLIESTYARVDEYAVQAAISVC